RSFAAAGALEGAEQKDPRDGGGSARPDGGEALLSTVDHQNQAECVPEPSIASPCGHDHQNAEPPRRAPAVHAAHQAVIVRIDLVPDSSSDGHTHSSAARCGMAT